MTRIAAIHIYQHDLPVVGPAYKMALSSLTALDTTLVEIVTDTGISGFGETCPLGPTYQPAHASGARAALQDIAPHLIGMDPIQILNISRRMDNALSGHAYAKAAIDIALWDLSGKLLGQRVCDLLGGATATSVPSYYAIGITSPDDAAHIAREKQAEGYARLQLKIGGRDIEEDIAATRKLFEVRAPGTRIALDANRSLTTRDAVLLSSACRDLNFVLEQPCDSYREIRALAGKLHHPLYLDECATDLATISGAIHDNVADGFGMKTTRVGGLSPMRAVRDLCHAINRPLSCDDAWGGDILAAACVHMGATVHPHLLEGVWIAAPYISGHYDSDNPVTIENGRITVPTAPGLGITPDTSAWTHVATAS